ncbi:PIN domain-containing protein [Thiofilum flexile]|uniref:PIN domain-containing protein n=1 Tax=Thiofilum flexile TaxID=125627 RepID=UPI00036E4E23|nr:type II toxin-antitoxin system VapC family toxin [Thiofilum flexile]
MIGLDTNVIVRYLTQDDPIQSPLASTFIEQQLSTNNLGVISQIVLCEVAWVLSRAYHYPREQVAQALHALLTCQEFQVECADLAILAWHDYVQGNADFSDYLLARTHQQLGADYTITFDRKAAHTATFKLLV